MLSGNAAPAASIQCGMNPQIAPSLDPRIPDFQLAQLVAAGDQPAFRLLMRRHNQMLFRTARSILRNEEEAEDALQDAYIHAYRSIGSFRGDAKLSTWLVRIVVNESIARRRRAQRGAQVIPLDADPESRAQAEGVVAESDEAQPEREALRAQTRRIIERKIDALPDAFRTVFMLRAVQEMSVEEAAACLDIPEATVRSRMFRARGLLRESLARELDVAIDGAFPFLGERCDRIVAGVLARLQEIAPRGA